MEGGCTCRQIRYRLTGTPLIVHACHCRWCQRETGTAHALNALYEADRVVHTAGEPEIIDTPSASGRGQKIARCPICKVAIWSNYPQAGPAVRFVRVGTLDDPDRCPQTSTYSRHRSSPGRRVEDGRRFLARWGDQAQVLGWTSAESVTNARDLARTRPKPFRTATAVGDRRDGCIARIGFHPITGFRPCRIVPSVKVALPSATIPARIASQASNVAAWSRQARDQAEANWVSRRREHDRNNRCRLLCRQDRRGSAPGDDINLQPTLPIRADAETPASVGGEPGGTSGSIHGLGYLFSALRRDGLIADELVLQLATFLRSLDLFLELTVRTVPRTLTTNQVRRGGKQGTDDTELSRIHFPYPASTRQTAGSL
jgi:hypothetical protein